MNCTITSMCARYGSGQLKCIDLKVRQSLGAKPELKNQPKPTHNYGEEWAVTLGERFWGQYVTLCYRTDLKN